MRYICKQRRDGGVAAYPSSWDAEQGSSVRLISHLQPNGYEYINTNASNHNAHDMHDAILQNQQCVDVTLHQHLQTQQPHAHHVHDQFRSESEAQQRQQQGNYWVEMFRYLLELCAKIGGGLDQALAYAHHTRDIELVAWIEDQDEQYARLSRGLPSSLTLEKLEMLSKLDFSLDEPAVTALVSKQMQSHNNGFSRAVQYGNEIPRVLHSDVHIKVTHPQVDGYDQGLTRSDLLMRSSGLGTVQNSHYKFLNDESSHVPSDDISHTQEKFDDCRTLHLESSSASKSMGSSRKISCVEDSDVSTSNDENDGVVSRQAKSNEAVQVTPNFPRSGLTEPKLDKEHFSIACNVVKPPCRSPKLSSQGAKKGGRKKRQAFNQKPVKPSKRGKKQKCNNNFPIKSKDELSGHMTPDIYANVSPDLLSSDECDSELQRMEIKHLATCLMALKTSSAQHID